MNQRFTGLYAVCVVSSCLQLGCQRTNPPAPPSSPPSQTVAVDQSTAVQMPPVSPQEQTSQPASVLAPPTPLIELPEFDVSAEIFSKNEEWKVVVDGKPSAHGIFEHPPSDGSASVSFPLDGKYEVFVAGVAINDTARGNNGTVTPLTFAVQGDGKELWRSRPAQKCGEIQPLSVDVSGVNRLTLIVECKGAHGHAHAVWVEPMLGSKGGAVPDVPGPRRLLWQIGKPDGESGFDGNPADDPEVVNFKIGDPEEKFPEGLGTDIGPQRSKIQIHFTGPIPTGTKLHVTWTPGGSDAVDQFKVDLDGKPLGISPALPGSEPGKLRTDRFAVPASSTKDHVLVFSHPQGDGLGLRHIRMEAEISN